jgi:hypothetical protein
MNARIIIHKMYIKNISFFQHGLEWETSMQIGAIPPSVKSEYDAIFSGDSFRLSIGGYSFCVSSITLLKSRSYRKIDIVKIKSNSRRQQSQIK